MCQLEIATTKRQYYKSFIKTSTTGEKFLDPTLSQEKQSELFALLNKAIKAENLEFLDHSVISRSDDLEIWELCKSRYAPTEKLRLEKKTT